jgi:hypothetical protein
LEHRENTVVDEAPFMVERGGLEPKQVSREIILTVGVRRLFFVATRENTDFGSTFWFMLAMQT